MLLNREKVILRKKSAFYFVFKIILTTFATIYYYLQDYNTYFITNHLKHMKNRYYIIITTLLLCLSAQAKTTYIPSYRSFIQIKNDSDSIIAQSKLETLELIAQDHSFSVTIVHENVDKEKVKAIKRAKAAAGWMTFAAIMSGVSAGFNSAYYNNALTTYIDMRRTENLAVLSGFMHDVSKGEQHLDINFFIDNLSNEELMVADLARGLTWYIQPHTSMQFTLPNPGIEHLRISDLHHSSVKYADIIGGNSVTKETIEWEDDNCWIIQRQEPSVEEFEGGSFQITTYNVHYYYIDKSTFESKEMTVAELKDFKKTHKEK